MATIPDITSEKLESWDQYRNKQPDDVLASVYAHIEKVSRQMCAWYWSSIRTKRNTSLAVRWLSFFLLVLGTSFPIFAALQTSANEKLLLTQLAVAFLVIAGLVQLADRIFGWSSGWMRYISVVTTMENLTRAFEMEWAKYLVAKAALPDSADAKALFELAKGLEQELLKLQAEETTKWVAEFNTGIALLDTMIKTQREETDKKLEAIRTSLTVKESALKADEKAKIAGALEVTLTFKAEPKAVKIGIDEESSKDFLGNFWTRLDVSPGRHVVRVTTTSAPARTIERIVEVKPDSLTKLDIPMGE